MPREGPKLKRTPSKKDDGVLSDLSQCSIEFKLDAVLKIPEPPAEFMIKEVSRMPRKIIGIVVDTHDNNRIVSYFYDKENRICSLDMPLGVRIGYYKPLIEEFIGKFYSSGNPFC